MIEQLILKMLHQLIIVIPSGFDLIKRIIKYILISITTCIDLSLWNFHFITLSYFQLVVSFSTIQYNIPDIIQFQFTIGQDFTSPRQVYISRGEDVQIWHLADSLNGIFLLFHLSDTKNQTRKVLNLMFYVSNKL